MNSNLLKPKAKEKSLIYKNLSSLKLAISLFIILALIITLGTYLPQEPLVGKTALIEQFGERQYQILKFWGLNDIFHSYWYLALLFLLGANLWTVSFSRVFPRARKAFYWPKFLNQSPSKGQFLAILEADQWEKLLKFCKKNYWQIKVNDSNKAAVLRKGAYHRLGASITHIGILFTMFGALISLIFGFNGVVQGIPDDRFIISDKLDSKRSYILVQTSQIFHAPFWLGFSPEFEVEIGKTQRFDYKNGDPKQWETELQFYSNEGELLAHGKASVNHPVRFRGVDFYQADWKRILRLNFNNQNFELELDKLKNTNSEIAFTSLGKNLGLLFLLPQNSNKLQLISVKGKFEPKNLQKNLQLLALISTGEKAQIGPMKFEFLGAFSKTGLQYKYSPGDNLMIVGMSILILGVLTAFGSKRVIWLVKEKDKIYILGNTDRSKDLFMQEFKKIYQSASSEALVLKP